MVRWFEYTFVAVFGKSWGMFLWRRKRNKGKSGPLSGLRRSNGTVPSISAPVGLVAMSSNTIDTSSIVSNKEATKSFWEQRMMEAGQLVLLDNNSTDLPNQQTSVYSRNHRDRDIDSSSTDSQDSVSHKNFPTSEAFYDEPAITSNNSDYGSSEENGNKNGEPLYEEVDNLEAIYANIDIVKNHVRDNCTPTSLDDTSLMSEATSSFEPIITSVEPKIIDQPVISSASIESELAPVAEEKTEDCQQQTDTIVADSIQATATETVDEATTTEAIIEPAQEEIITATEKPSQSEITDTNLTSNELIESLIEEIMETSPKPVIVDEISKVVDTVAAPQPLVNQLDEPLLVVDPQTETISQEEIIENNLIEMEDTHNKVSIIDATPKRDSKLIQEQNAPVVSSEAPVVIATTPSAKLLKKSPSSQEESIIAREIRLQRDREQEIANERKKAAQQLLEQKKASPVAEEASNMVNNQEELVDAKAFYSVPRKPSQKVENIPQIVETLKPALIKTLDSPKIVEVSEKHNNSAVFPVVKKFNAACGSKIADEIREFKEREDELRRMREQLHVQPATEPSVIEQKHIPLQRQASVDDIESVNSEDSFVYSANSVAPPTVESIQNGQKYNMAHINGGRRRDKITVKPLDDGDASADKIKTLQKETPLEREIRLAKEREETIRCEKGLLERVQKQPNGTTTPTTNGGVVNNKSPTTMQTDHVELKQTSGTTNSPKSVATSRIQQEIEEQTQREMALRAAGHIQTISSERTDAKVTRIGDATPKMSRESSIASTPSPVSDRPFHMDLSRRSSSSSTSSTVTSSSMSPVSNHHQPLTNGRGGVNMQKFIASRGKEVVVSKPAENGGNIAPLRKTFSDSNGSIVALELIAPQVKNGIDMTSRRGPVSAETKIQRELRAMKEREEELRRQRLLGRSEPNLSTLESSTDESNDDDPTDGVRFPSLRERVCSNPNLLEAIDEPKQITNGNSSVSLRSNGSASTGSSCSEVIQKRRKSALIMQWEQRCQQ